MNENPNRTGSGVDKDHNLPQDARPMTLAQVQARVRALAPVALMTAIVTAVVVAVAAAVAGDA